MNHWYVQWGKRISQEVNEPEGKQARGRTSQRANQPGTGGKQARERKSQRANEPEGEQARGRTSHNSIYGLKIRLFCLQTLLLANILLFCLETIVFGKTYILVAFIFFLA